MTQIPQITSLQQFPQITQVPQFSQYANMVQTTPQMAQLQQYNHLAQVPQVSQYGPVTLVQHVGSVPQMTHSSPVYYQHSSISEAASEQAHTILKPYPVYIKEDQPTGHSVVKHHPSPESSYWYEPEPMYHHKPHSYGYHSHEGILKIFSFV